MWTLRGLQGFLRLRAINKQRRGGAALRSHTPVTGDAAASAAVFIKEAAPDSEAFKRPSRATTQQLPWDRRGKGVKVSDAISA